MFKYYCMLVHTNPKQVRLLINALDDEFSKFYIHVDLKCDIGSFQEVIKGNNVHFINKRYKSNWGSINLVLATIEIFKTVISNENKIGFFILLSGSDYPIKSNKFISDFLINNSEYNFINIDTVDTCWSSKEVKRRLKQYNFCISNNRKNILSIPPINSNMFYEDFYKNIKKVYTLIKSKQEFNFFLLLKKRKDIIIPYGGAQWIALNRRTVDIILNWISYNPQFLKSHKFTFVPDEFFFQSIIKHLQNKFNIQTKSCLTYANWNRKNVKLPVTFTSNDILELKVLDDNILFARKFNTVKDESVFKNIDLKIRNMVNTK